MNDPSVPLTRAREERFALLLAESDGGLSLSQAWVQSDPAVVTPEVTPGRRVSASKAFKRVADRVAWIKQQAASTAPTEALTAERLSSLMEGTTASLLDAARHAQKVGANNIAQSLRRVLTVHAGRSSRLDQRVPAQEKIGGAVDVESILTRLHFCTCSKEA